MNADIWAMFMVYLLPFFSAWRICSRAERWPQ